MQLCILIILKNKVSNIVLLILMTDDYSPDIRKLNNISTTLTFGAFTGNYNNPIQPELFNEVSNGLMIYIQKI